MAITTKEEQYKRLRSYLSPYIKGPATDAILEALAVGNAAYLIDNVRAVNDQLYIATASGRYLDERLADAGIVRPPSVGLSDEVFRQIGIEVKNRKQVRDLINNLLDAIFGDEFVRATSQARAIQPYNLMDGDTLLINFDEKNTVPITFTTSQFQNIAAATAQEVADAITKNLRALGFNGTAIAKDDGNGPYVQLISDTIGPASSVTVLGGRAQNELLFDSVVPAGGNMSTQWTLSLQPGGVIRYTWTGGANPQLGKVNAGNYVNIFNGGFAASANEGSYTITKAIGGAIGVAYFEVVNPLGTPGIIVQGTDDAIRFYNPERKTLSSRLSYAAVYQANPRMLQVFLPAATKVVRRDRIGSAHLHDPADPISLLPNQQGPYMYDETQPFTVSDIGTTLSQNLDGTMSRVITVANSALFPDTQGNIILGYGTSVQEGPIPYIARPSNNTLLISPAYTIKNTHTMGEDVALVSSKAPAEISRDGLDYPFYITDVVSGRLYAQDLINSVAATGITIVFTILYPSDIGLGKWGTVFTENPTIWGE
jgi:hypothetical protein